MSEAGPQVNGPSSPPGKFIDGIDPDDPEYIKNLQRPAEVKEDLQQMENRSRVSLVLNSQAFKDELEQVVEEQLRNGPYPANLIALQQITDLLLPHSKGGLSSLARASTAIPINDLRGVESLGFAKGEKLLRCKLAALYRLVDLCGWSHGIYNHISARISPEHEHFLLNPFGMLYSEVTASSLIKVDVRGDIVESGSTQFGVSKSSFSLHSAIHQARPDIKCIVHLHTPAAVAVSAMKCGLLPMSQEALVCGKLSYHDYQGVFVDPEEREKLARSLGVHNKILVLRNQGIVACGETIEEAFHYTFNIMAACEAQVKAVPAGLENIVIPSEEVREKTYRVASQGGGGVESTGRKWKLGELEFEALMRTLDNSGFRTGYVYKMPVVKQEKKDRSNSEVEIPPASSSFTYVFDGDFEHSKYASPIKAAMERQKKAYKAGWLTTPNAYKKTEVEEIGTTTPKKITKWVPEADSPNRPGGTPIKIENPNQFAPQGENPREFKLKQKSIRKDYYEEKVTPGPQSKILEGISWDEAQKAKDGQLSGAGDQLIVVGAASKGIIQRDHQHNAVVYRQYYAANPFENMSEAEIEQYQAEVQRRERGEPVEEPTATPATAAPTSHQAELEKPREPEPVHTVEQVRDVERQPEPRKDVEVGLYRLQEESNGLHESDRSFPSEGPHPLHEDKLLAQLADKVVQTVFSDALSVIRRGKGQQTLTGTEPLHQHSHYIQSHMGSQISVDSGRQSAEDHSGSQLLYRDRQDNYPVRNDKGQSHGASTCTDWFNNVKTPSRDETAEAAGAAFEDLRWSESGASNPEDDFVTIALDPIQLYHGQAESGTMKVRFSIQSTVRRRIRAELNRGGGTIEEVHASVSEPSIDHIHIERNNFDASENVNFKQKTTRRHRKVLTNFKHSPTSSTHLQNKTGINYSGGVGEAMIAISPNLMKRLSGNSDNGAGEAGEGNKEQTSSHSQNVQQDKIGASSDNNSGSLSNYGSKQNGSQNTESPLDKNSDLLFADDYPEDDIPSSQQQPLSTPTSFNTHVKKCKKLRKGQLKHKKTFVPLSPVLEEKHHTPQHCEALGGILEETDLSFDQLFNEDVLLSDDGRSCDLNLNDFMGAAPIVKEEEFNECITCSDILFDSEKAKLLNTKVFKQGNQLDSDQLQKPIVDLPPVVPAAECTNSRDLVPQNFEPSLCVSSEPQTNDHLYLKDNDLLKERDGESKTSHTTLQTVKQDIMFDIEQEKSLNFQHIPLSVSENSYKNCLHNEIQNIPHLTKCPDKMNPQLELKMSAHILEPVKETLIDDIAAKSTPFLKTRKETLIDDVDPEVVTTPGSLPKRIESLIDDVPYIPHKVGLQHKHFSILDEGPLQTSSPKLGRPKSRESPFKSYHQKLGKSEETLLDIMPLEHQNTKIVAKSQEELEDCKQLMKITLSRACSLGPHHRKKVDNSSSLKPNIKSKETNIDDVLDQYNLLIHGELTGGNNFFIPPVIVAYPLTSATTESADLSDSERQRINFSRNPPQATRGTRPSSNPPWPFNPPPREARPRYQSEDFSNKTASGESQPKRRWTPKPKRQRQSQTQDEQDIQVPDSKVDDTRARATTDSLERSKEKNENYDQDQDNDRLHDKAGSQRQHRRRNPDDREDYDKRGKDDKHRRRDDKYRQQEDDVNYRHREDKREKHRDDRERRREDDRDRHSEDYRDRYREDRDRHRDNKARETEQKSSNKINNEPLDFAQDKKEQRGKVIVKNRGESVFLPNFSDDASYAQDRKNETEIERDIKRSLSSDRSRRVVYHNRRTRSEEDEEDRRNADDPRRKRRSDGDKLRDNERRLREEIDTTLDETNEDLPFHRLRQDERRRKGRSAPEMNQRVSGRVNKRADRDDVKRGHRDERNPEADDFRANDSFHSFTEKGPKYEILEQSPPSVRRAVPIDTNQHRYSQSGTSPTKDRLPEETRVEPLSPQEKLAFILKSSAPHKKRNTEDLPPVPPREPVDEYGDTLLDKSKGNKPSLDIVEKKREIITSDQQYPDKTKKIPQELTVEDAPKNLESVASLKKGKSKVYKDNLERELEDQYSVVTKPLKAYGSKEKNRIVDHPIIEPESDQIANPFKIEKKLDVTEKEENFDSDKRNVEKNNNGDKKSADQPRKEKERTSRDRKKEKEISMTEPEELGDKHSESHINREKSKKDYKPIEKTEFKKPERPKTSNVDDVEVRKLDDEDRKPVEQPRRENERYSRDRKKETDISMTEPEEISHRHSENYITLEKSKKLDYKPVEKTEFKKPERPKTSNVDDVEVRKLDDEDRKPVEQPRREIDRSSRDRKKETEISVTGPEEISDKHSESYIDPEKSKKDYKPVEKTELKKPERPKTKTSNVDDVEVRKLDDEDRKPFEQQRREKERSSRERKKETEIPMTKPEEFNNNLENYISRDNSKKLENRPVEKTEFKKPERPKTSNVDDVEVRKLDDEDRKPVEQPRREIDRSSRDRKKEKEISMPEPEVLSDKKYEKPRSYQRKPSVDYEEEVRKPDHSSFKEDKIAPKKKRNDAPADEVPLNIPKAADLDLPVKRERKQNRKYDYEQPTEESKPGRKDDFDDKKTHIKPLPYEDTVKKADKQELEPYLYARGRRSGRIPKRTAKVEEPKKEEDSDEQQNDLGELLAENPIELTIDDNNNNDSNDEEQPTPVKKNILSIFSCVGGKSSDGLKKKSKSPLNKSKGYYEEGEKRKIKKLNKEKEKEEKTKMYFEEPEGLESVLPSGELSETPDAESAKEEVPELPFVPLTELSHEPRQSGRRYQKKVKPFEVHKPLSFVDPVLMADAFVDEDSDEDNSLPPLGTFKRWNEDNVQEPKLSSFMSAKRDENKFNSFQRFGFGRRNIMPHSEAKGDVSSTVVPVMDRDKEEAVPKDIGENDVEDSFDFSFMSSDPEADITATETEPIKLKGGSSDPSKYMKNKNKVEIVDVIPDHVFEKNESISPAEMDSFPPSIERPASKIVETDSFKVNGIDSTNEITINIEAPTPESTLTGDISYNAVNYHSHQPYTNDFDSSYEHHDADVLNTSAPAYMYADRHDSDSEKNLFAPSHVFDSSFDSPDMLYRRKHRTVSFDERITGSHSYHDAASRPPDTLSLISEPVTSRPRSSSATSNPLTYEPWRVKAYNKNRRSLSVSDMLYGKGSSRPHKCHSIGEIYNSTVASSVARRRAKTLVSGDIVSRMYQPRQRSRSRALLGDASFGSVAPIRQRSFSGFDHANSSGSGEPTGIKRSESERQPSKKPQLVVQDDRKNVERSKSDRRQQKTLGDAKPASPSKSDTLRSTDSASGGETLEERSSKEGSPTKEHPSPTKEKKKKKKFRIPSFSKKKSKEHKESAM